MLDCPPCDSNCDGQSALTFDPSYNQHPDGPVCGSPADIDCPVQCDPSLDEYECCSRDDCPNKEFCMDFKCHHNDITSTATETPTTTETTYVATAGT